MKRKEGERREEEKKKGRREVQETRYGNYSMNLYRFVRIRKIHTIQIHTKVSIPGYICVFGWWV